MENNLSKEVQEYRKKLLKVNNPRIAKITNSWGSKYIYRSVPKTHIIKSVKEEDFLHIIRVINDMLAEELSTGTPIELPYIGTLALRMRKTFTYYDEEIKGISTNRPVDWKSTYMLWYEDEEARNEKLLVRFKIPYIYEVEWIPTNFNNKRFFKFRACRNLKRLIKKNVNEDNVFAYLKQTYYDLYGKQ